MELRRQLNRTWYAFLAHHPHPRPIQVRAATPILAGRSVLLASATASGKTEAYAAPLVERWFERCVKGEPKVLIVGPTRALVNDLARRLEGPLRRCGIGLTRRTGDHPNDLTAEQAGVIVTTPESLDSVLSRHPRWLGATGSVVLDELHVLQGTPRGDQVLCLLERLERVVVALGGQPPQRLAATATAANPDEVAARYLGAGSVVLVEESQRDFDLHLADCTSPAEMLHNLAERCRALGARKVLCFMPSRQEAEIYGAQLLGRPPFQTRVFVHHGSLSRQERERVEKAFLKAPSALCLATNTLELGIDIGDVDMVALFGAPPEVSSFLQRIGRGNRRGGRGQVLGLCRHAGERQRMAHLGECAAEGRLYIDPDRPFRSVAVQQAFSLLFQNPRRQIALAPLADRLPAWLELDSEVLERILDRLVEREWLVSSGHGYQPTAKLEREYERARLHQNFTSTRATSDEVEVVDGSGRVLGKVQRGSQGLPESIVLGGRSRRLGADRGRQVVASGSGEGGKAIFVSRGTARIPAGLAEDFRRFLGYRPDQVPVAAQGSRVILGHFLGSVRGAVLRDLVARQTKLKVGLSPFLLWADFQELPDFSASAEELEQLLATRPTKLVDSLNLGPWTRELPRELMVEELRRHLEPEQLAERLRRLEPVKAEPEMAEVLRSLAPALEEGE